MVAVPRGLIEAASVALFAVTSLARSVLMLGGGGLAVVNVCSVPVTSPDALWAKIR